MTTTNSLGSGCEVESATFHAPISGGMPMDASSSSRSGFRGTLDDLKSRGMATVHDVQQKIGQRSAMVKTNVNGQMTKVQDSMKTSPMLWAGIAAGSGFALGLIGRFVHWRNYHRRMTPDLVIIDASC